MMSAPWNANRTSSVPLRQSRGRIGALALTTALAMGCATLIATPAVAAADGSGVVINEAYLSGGSAGAAFTNKFVELYNPTDADIALDGTSLQYRSATGAGSFNGVVALSGTVPAGGYFLVQGGSNGTNGSELPAADASGNLNPSGTNGTLALVDGTAAVGLEPGSVVGADGVIDLLGYGTSNTFEAAPATSPANNQDARSLNRAEGADTDDNSADFSLSASITPQGSGGGSPEEPEQPEEPVAATIAEVQGTEDVAALYGRTVTVEGVITADHRTGGYDGVVIQSAGSGGDADATPGASDGVFVHLRGKTVPGEIGDLVSVTGAVSEYFGQTQISPANEAAVVLLAPGVGIPAVTPLPESVIGAEREAYENMLVAPDGTYRVASSHQLYNFGTLWLNPGELNVKSTETTSPGDEANAIAAQNRAERLLLDDGYSVQVSNNTHPGEQPYFTEDITVRNGDVVDFAEDGYVLQYGFDDWRLQPVTPITDTTPAAQKAAFTADNTRPEKAPQVGGDVQVAAFNVFNYFTTMSEDDSEARGAKNEEFFEVQRSKIVAAIGGLDADVVALMEIENSVHFGDGTPDVALADLVKGLNDAAGSEVWDFVPTPEALLDTDTDVITNAIIYKKDDVTPVGDSLAKIDESVWGNAREPIAQAFDIDGKTVSVVANHFKSKSGDGDEPADGQGHFNADRTAQAQSLLEFTGEIEQATGSPDVLLLGDFNAYAREDPINVFSEAGWTDLVPAHAAGQHTYSFDGELGSLDHAIASPSLAASVTGTGVWTINSPEWSDRGYAFGAAESGTPFRSSDHDPVVVGISSQTPPVSIDIVTINDFHGRIEADDAAAGAAVLSGAVKSVREANANTIFAANGDLIGASTFTSFIDSDNPTIDALNAAGLEVSSVGNHEFDQGWDDLRDRVEPRAEWPYLGANVFLTGTDDHAGEAYFVREVDGVKVGFIGAVTEDLPSLVSPDGLADLEIRDIAESVNAVAADLKDGEEDNGEADVIILLVHEGAAGTEASNITSDTPLGEILDGLGEDVNAVSTAHTHQVYNHVIDGRPVFQAGQYGENFALTSLSIDPQTKELLSITNEIKPLTKAVKDPETGDTTYVPLYDADPAVQEIVDAAKEQADILGAEPVGEITGDFNRARQSDGTENRGGESTIGNFVADVHKWATGADIAIMNPGGIRANLAYASTGASDPDGNVTFREAATVQPFANTLVTLNLTGAQIKGVLEEQWQPEGASRPFLKLGVSEGLQYTYDPTAAAGERITSITLNGETLDPTASYVVAANSFLAAGGDNFSTFAEGTGKADTGKVDLASTVEWFDEHGNASPDLAQRAVGVTLSAPDADGYSAGDEVTIDLSSLAFSGGDPAPGEVTVSLGGNALTAGAVDPAIVDTTDEAGRASLTFTVPSGMLGEQQLTVAVADAGTSVQVPIELTEAGGSGGGGDGDGDGSGGDGTGGQDGTSGAGDGDLATTGADPTPYVVLAALLLMLGSALVVARRRTRTVGTDTGR